jgi:hypothetical protein
MNTFCAKRNHKNILPGWRDNRMRFALFLKIAVSLKHDSPLCLRAVEKLKNIFYVNYC